MCLRNTFAVMEGERSERMTDNEIIKALECCGDESGINHACSKCPKFKDNDDFCETALHNQALDLINRQKAEIERLGSRIFALNDTN